MHNIKTVTRVFSAFLLATSAVSYAAPPVVVPSNVAPTYVAMWKKGNAMETKAVAKLTKAQQKLAKANEAIVAANAKQSSASGESNVAAAEFAQLIDNKPIVTSSIAAQAYAKRVTDASKRWASADNRNSDGGKELDKATRNKSAAEAEIINAQTEIEQARGMMAKAQGL
jgi:hypothetical protein